MAGGLREVLAAVVSGCCTQRQTMPPLGIRPFPVRSPQAVFLPQVAFWGAGGRASRLWGSFPHALQSKLVPEEPLGPQYPLFP